MHTSPHAIQTYPVGVYRSWRKPVFYYVMSVGKEHPARGKMLKHLIHMVMIVQKQIRDIVAYGELVIVYSHGEIEYEGVVRATKGNTRNLRKRLRFLLSIAEVFMRQWGQYVYFARIDISKTRRLKLTIHRSP